MIAENSHATADIKLGAESTPESQAASEVQSRPMPEAPSDTKSQVLQEAIARCNQEAHIVERALPAVMLGAMAAKHLGEVVTPSGYAAYLAKLIADRGQPLDAIERMFLEQLAWCHCR